MLISNVQTEHFSYLQLTFFRCGGVCLGAAFYHTAADGFGALAFINSWSKITQSKTPILIPPQSFNRTILRSRSPPSITSPHIEYSQTPLPPSSSPLPFISSILKLSNNHLSLLKNPSLSTFNAVASHIWRSFCKARLLHPSCNTRLHFTANARTRLIPPPPANYFGNAAVRTSAVTTVENVLGFGGAETIDGTTKRIDDEFVRSLLDYLEEKVEEAGVRKGEFVMPETDLWAISWLGLPIYEADFGWGKPVYMGRACLEVGGLVYILPSSIEEEEGGVTVMISMEEEIMGRFKDVFYEDIA